MMQVTNSGEKCSDVTCPSVKEQYHKALVVTLTVQETGDRQ